MVVKSIYIRMILYGHPRFSELRHSLLRGNDGANYASLPRKHESTLSVGEKEVENLTIPELPTEEYFSCKHLLRLVF